MIRIINEAKEGLEEILRYNDAIGNKRKIFNVKKNIGEKTNKLVKHKKNQKKKN